MIYACCARTNILSDQRHNIRRKKGKTFATAIVFCNVNTLNLDTLLGAEGFDEAHAFTLEIQTEKLTELAGVRCPLDTQTDRKVSNRGLEVGESSKFDLRKQSNSTGLQCEKCVVTPCSCSWNAQFLWLERVCAYQFYKLRGYMLTTSRCMFN